MSIGIVIVTHGRTGQSLIEEAEYILCQPLDSIESVSFNQSTDEGRSVAEIHTAIETADQGDGVLVLTDLIGSSPSNRVCTLIEHFNAVMVTGVNLAMVISVWNYRDSPLGLLTRKAVDAGRRGVKIFQK